MPGIAQICSRSRRARMTRTLPARREDILVSVCLTDVPVATTAFAEIVAFADRLASRFRFYEIIIVTESTLKGEFLPLVKRIPNMRLFTVREGLSPYRHRVVATSEAIGDVVLLASQDQFGTLDHITMIECAANTGQIVVGQRPKPRGIGHALSVLLQAAGRAAGFRAGLQDGPTIAIQRSLLTPLLQHSDPDLALRFIPRDPMFPTATFAYLPGKIIPAEGHGIASRFQLIEKLVLHMAPRVLQLVALSSALLIGLGLAYMIYAIGVWAFVPKIQPGWLTISVIMSLVAVFLGGSIFGLSVGMQRLLALLRSDRFDHAAQEINRTDLFGHLVAELNVDMHRSKP